MSTFNNGRTHRAQCGQGYFLVFLLLASLASTANASGTQPASRSIVKTNSVMNDIPPRLQWGANYGYCGETSLISAGLYYGQYVSQYDARAIASPNTPQSRRDSQLLLGANDESVAAHMRLKAVEWKGGGAPDAKAFLTWVKGNVVAGYPVIIGVYENLTRFEEADDEITGDDEYDHIVPVIGVASRSLNAQPAVYQADDVITFSDNGLWSSEAQPGYLYRVGFDAFQASREGVNDAARPVYSLPNDGKNYGVAITGIVDRDGKTLPVRLTTDVNGEAPAMLEGSDARPASAPLNLTVTVSGLTPGVAYTLYRYDSFDKVPESAFNGHASQAVRRWKIDLKAGSTYEVKETIRSDQVAVYRAVPVTAP